MVNLLYSVMAFTSAIIVLVLNISELRKNEKNSKADRAYNILSRWVIIFCLQDVLWGVTGSDLIMNRRLFFISSVIFHVSTAITTFLWVNYVVTYLQDRIKKNIQYIIRFLGFLIILLQSTLLTINCFTPIMFWIDEDMIYQTGFFRSVSFFAQYVAYIIIAIATLFVYFYKKDEKHEVRQRYLAVILFVMSPILCGVFQFLFPEAPFHSIGYMLGCCVIHSFVVSSERRELLQIKADSLKSSLDVVTEDLIKAKEDAEHANQAKTEFLFNMSHDLRTPMNAIIGFTNLLEKGNIDEATRSDYITKIQASSHVMLEIINNVLEMAKIESGNMTYDETLWNTDEFTTSFNCIFEEDLRKKDLHFSCYMNLNHKYIWGDSTKLKEILINIFSNAIKYTPNGGSIHMTLTEQPSPQKGYILFQTTLADNGQGMSKDFLPHLFESFSREHNTTYTKITGTGLGMSITKKLVDFLNGTIEVESELGRGTKFIVTIPHRIATADEIAASEKKEIEFTPIDLTGKRVLLAEDNDLNAEIAITLLEEYGIKTDRAVDGEECVNMLKNTYAGYYDLIFMDIQMPKMNGYEATKVIRGLDSKLKDIPIIAMTANAFEEDKNNAINVGMNGHIAKPIDIARILQEVSLVLSK